MEKTYEEIVDEWCARCIADEGELSLAIGEKAAEMSYHSSRLENDRITMKEVKDIFDGDSVFDYTGHLFNLYEIRNSKIAYEYFLSSYSRHVAPDEKMLCEMQRLLTLNIYDDIRWRKGERPGQYKKNEYVTGRLEVGAAPKDVQREVASLMAEVPDIDSDRILTGAAYFHAKIENIHPFAMGNGRTGRLFMNYILAFHNHPIIIIHEEDAKAYYSALEAWDRTEELSPLVAFLMEQTVKTWS